MKTFLLLSSENKKVNRRIVYYGYRSFIERGPFLF